MLPYATSLPGVGGRLRVEPEDFVVEEIPAYEASGEGQHLMLWLAKRDTSHESLIEHLAQCLGVTRREIGVAGIKDRRAVTRQRVSVPAVGAERLASIDTESIRLLHAERHGHKLRTGHLRGNRFSILLRGVAASDLQLAVRIQEEISGTGVLNYFGSQRFGYRGQTLRQGCDLLTGRQRAERLPRKRRDFLLRLALSAVQSELFNQVLAQRMRDGLSRTVLPGDVMQVVASGGPFVATDERVEQARFDAGETVIAGPLFGPKMLSASGRPAELEGQVLAANGISLADFERFPRLTRGTRRSTWIQPQEFSISAEPPGLRFEFSLPAGSYATVVLREFIKRDEAAEESR